MSRRSVAVRGIQLVLVASAFDGALGEAGDEPFEEEVEDERDRDGHQTVAAWSDCQKKTSPRTSSVGTPVAMTFSEEGETNEARR